MPRYCRRHFFFFVSILKNCLSEMNTRLEQELRVSRQLAKQCEDEAVDLRRQLCAALKELAKLKAKIPARSGQENMSPKAVAETNSENRSPGVGKVSKCIQRSPKERIAGANPKAENNSPCNTSECIDFGLGIQLLKDTSALWSRRIAALKVVEAEMDSPNISDETMETILSGLASQVSPQ
mmetsp:Transcript_85210/g.227287  ORF Transcript_85210/g.227287 Transcript_85210/m.227287 type:complete len:181 (+) Transcript_85210:563-1105(+)